MKSTLFKAMATCFGGGIQTTGKGVQLAGKGAVAAGIATIDAGVRVEAKGTEIREDLGHRAAAAREIEQLDRQTAEETRHAEAMARLEKAQEKERRKHQRSVSKLRDQPVVDVDAELVPDHA